MSLDPAEVALLAVAGLTAGVVNAIAGGGTFLTFPALLATGLPPLIANASNAVAVWPGHAFAVPAYRQRLAAMRDGLARRVWTALAGGLVGAGLLLVLGERVFTALIPWLLLLATVLFRRRPASCRHGGPLRRTAWRDGDRVRSRGVWRLFWSPGWACCCWPR